MLNNEFLTKSWALIGTFKRFFISLVQNFFSYGCQKSAAALTYITLFAIVPLMTVMYSVFSVIPTFNGVAEQLQNFIFSHFVPETGQEVQTYLSSFSSQARSLTGFGIAMLVVTSYLMLTNIEKTFNAIWGVQKGRKGLSSFLLYWAILSIGPILLGTGLIMSTYLLSLKLVMGEFDSLGVTGVVFQSLPLLFTSTAFTLLFVAVPNCRVPIRFAFIGGFITAICFELLKNLFGTMVANSSLHLVYGAFAVVPLFLLWVNLAWTIVLTGAILVRTLAERSYIKDHRKRNDILSALSCLALFYQRNQTGGVVVDTDCYQLGFDVVYWQRLRGQFEQGKWITTTSIGSYILSRDLRSVSLWDLADLLELKIHDLDILNTSKQMPDWEKTFRERSLLVVAEAKTTMGISIEEVLTGTSATEKSSH